MVRAYPRLNVPLVEESMRPSAMLLLVLSLVASQTGCGTLYNLQAPPPVDPMTELGGLAPSTCAPFGGVQRSAVIGGCGVVMGPIYLVKSVVGVADGGADSRENVVGGLTLTGLGLLAIVDAPLSLAGDIVTMPVVIARRCEHPWATWWGEAKAAPMKDDGPEPQGTPCVTPSP
jgi:uncharacterized protein YceK